MAHTRARARMYLSLQTLSLLPSHTRTHTQPGKGGGGRGGRGGGRKDDDDDCGDNYPHHVEARAARDAKHRMALAFRWYLGLSSRWANAGEPSRRVDSTQTLVAMPVKIR